MEQKDTKQIVDMVVSSLKEDNVFDNVFLTEHVLRARLYKYLLESDIDVGDYAKIVDVSMKISSDIIRESIQSAVSSLIEKGIIENTDDESYRLTLQAFNILKNSRYGK